MHTFMQFKSAAKVQKKIDIRKRTRVFLVFYFSCQFFLHWQKWQKWQKFCHFCHFCHEKFLYMDLYSIIYYVYNTERLNL